MPTERSATVELGGRALGPTEGNIFSVRDKQESALDINSLNLGVVARARKLSLVAKYVSRIRPS